MARVESSLSLVSQVGILAIILLQDSSAVDPVTLQVFCTGSDGEEYLAGEVIAQTPSSAGCDGNRIAALADVPAGTAYRVVADNGVSAEGIALELVHGPVENVQLSSAVVAVRFDRVASNPDSAPVDTSDVTFSSQQGAYLAMANQSDASFFGADVRSYSYTPGGTRYQIAQGRLSAPSGIGNRALYLCESPAATRYVTSLWGDATATVAYRYGETNLILDGTYSAIPASGATSGTSPATVTYVCDENGDDATGERGNVLKPFKTIQAALDVCQDYDTVMVAPGTYTENVIVPDLFLTIEGMGSEQRARILAAAGIALFWQGSNGVRLCLKNLYIQTADFLGTACYLSGNGLINDCQVSLFNIDAFAASGFGVLIADMGYAYCESCNGPFGWLDCNDALTVGHRSGEAYCEVAEPIPANVALGWHRFKGCRFDLALSGIRLNANARIDADSGCYAENLLTDGAIGPSGAFRFAGECEDATMTETDGTGNQIILAGSRIRGTLNLTSTATAGDIYTDCRSATIGLLNMADNGFQNIVDLRGGSVGSYAFSTFGAECRVDRDGGSSALLAVPNGLTAFLFGANLAGPRYPNATQVAYCVQPSLLAAVATDNVAVTAGDGDGFTLNSGYVANQDMKVIYSRFELSLTVSD